MNDGKPERLAKDDSCSHQNDEMAEPDQHLYDHGIFISADGFSSSVPWKVRKYGKRGPLADEQINSIAAEFALGVEDLRRLSGSLGLELHPIRNLISISRSTAAARAAKEVQRARKEVETAIAAVNRAILRLECVQPNPPGGADSAERFQQVMVLPLKASLRQLGAARREINEISKTLQAALLIAPDDKRRLHDRRRESVLRAIFHFWANAGRKLTFTTDPLSSERRGPLIDFVNAVVACVTDPPGTLKAETIVAEIRKFPPEEVELVRDCAELFRKCFK